MKKRRNRTIYFIPAVIWGVIIIILSAVPGNKLPMPPIWNADKFAHLGVYFILSVLIIYGFWESHQRQASLRKPILLSIVTTILLGGILEILQEYLFIGRYGDYLDFTANTSGSLLAALLFSLINPFRWFFKPKSNS